MQMKIFEATHKQWKLTEHAARVCIGKSFWPILQSGICVTGLKMAMISNKVEIECYSVDS